MIVEDNAPLWSKQILQSYIGKVLNYLFWYSRLLCGACAALIEHRLSVGISLWFGLGFGDGYYGLCGVVQARGGLLWWGLVAALELKVLRSPCWSSSLLSRQLSTEEVSTRR